MLKDFLIMAALGAVAYLVFFVLWKKAASRWASWFPLFQKVAQFGLWCASAAVVVAVIYELQSFEDKRYALVGLLLGGALMPALEFFGNFKSKGEKHERGTKIATAATVKGMVKKEKHDHDIEIGGVPIPHGTEPYHFAVPGSTGSGKSVAIKGMLDTLRKRGDVVILVDSGGEFLSRYWDEKTDYVLNPFDDRCAPWSPTAELEGPWDAEALSRSMVPDGTGENKQWNAYAQTLVTSCLQANWERGQNSASDLLYAVQAAPMQHLAKLLEGTPAAAQLGSDRTFASIRTIAANYMAPYNYLTSNEEPFSVAKFIRTAESGFLYLTYRDDQLDSLRNLISCVLDIAARTILSLTPNPKRRVWLIIDEFASIGKVQSIEAVATKARKVGGCLVIGMQSISQLKERYGEHTAQSILSCLSSWLVLRCADADTAEYMSKYLGEEQITRTAEGSSSSESGGSKSWSEQTSTQRAVMASELQQLPNLHGFLKLAGHYPVCQVKLGLPENRPAVAEAFKARDFREKPMLKFSPPAPAPAAAAPAAPPPAQATNAPAPNQPVGSAQPAAATAPPTGTQPTGQPQRKTVLVLKRAQPPAQP